MVLYAQDTNWLGLNHGTTPDVAIVVVVYIAAKARSDSLKSRNRQGRGNEPRIPGGLPPGGNLRDL